MVIASSYNYGLFVEFNIYTLISPNIKSLYPYPKAALTHRGMDCMRPLKVCCGFWLQDGTQLRAGDFMDQANLSSTES